MSFTPSAPLRQQATEDVVAPTGAGTPVQRTIGRYSLLKILRQERRSITCLASDPVMNRQVIIKLVALAPAGSALDDPEHKRVEQAFMRQAQAAGALHHPHIVTVFDAGLNRENGYLVIERTNGRPLVDLLSGGVRLAYVQSASIAARVADAIEFAHQNGVCHGNLSIASVTLGNTGAPKVSGFGGWIDDGQGGDMALSRTPQRLPYFQSEVTDASRQTDIRALGGILHWLLTGQPAPRLDLDNTSMHLSDSERGSLTRSSRPQVPAALARLTDQALLSGHAQDSLKNAGELRDALTAFIWSERTDRNQSANFGIPLAPPPQPKPVLMATIMPDDNIDAFNDDLPAPAPADALPSVIEPLSNPEDGAAAYFATIDTPLPPTIDTVLPTEFPAPPPETAGKAPVPEPRFGHPMIRGLLLAAGFVLISALAGMVLARLAPGSHGIASAPGTTDTAKQAVSGADTSTVSFDIRPWGEVIIDGVPAGTSPPLKDIQLASGVHRIEIHHDSSPAWQADVDVRSPTPVRIEHQFRDTKAAP
jgi:serine/threonine-protein kinase